MTTVGSQEPEKGGVGKSGDDPRRETTQRRQSTTDPQGITKKEIRTGPNNTSQPESVRSQSPNPSQASPDHLQAAIEQALGDRWNQLARHVEVQQSELNRRVQTQLEETMADARARIPSERPVLNAVKPTKPPTYEGARQGTFTQWAFQVKQYLRLMNVHDEAYCVEFAASQFRGPAAL